MSDFLDIPFSKKKQNKTTKNSKTKRCMKLYQNELYYFCLLGWVRNYHLLPVVQAGQSVSIADTWNFFAKSNKNRMIQRINSPIHFHAIFSFSVSFSHFTYFYLQELPSWQALHHVRQFAVRKTGKKTWKHACKQLAMPW